MEAATKPEQKKKDKTTRPASEYVVHERASEEIEAQTGGVTWIERSRQPSRSQREAIKAHIEKADVEVDEGGITFVAPPGKSMQPQTVKVERVQKTIFSI